MITYTPASFLLPSILETDTFADTITFEIPAEPAPALPPPDVTSVNVVASREDAGVVVSTSFSGLTGSATIAGKYTGVFPNRTVLSVSAGSSDALETPREDHEFLSMEGRALISVSPDPRRSVTVEYELQINRADGSTDTQVFTKTVEQNYTTTAEFITQNTFEDT